MRMFGTLFGDLVYKFFGMSFKLGKLVPNDTLDFILFLLLRGSLGPISPVVAFVLFLSNPPIVNPYLGQILTCMAVVYP